LVEGIIINNDDAFKMAAGSISGAIAHFGIKFDWNPLAAVYGLEKLVNGDLIRHSNWLNPELSEAVFSFLMRCYKEEPEKAIQLVRRLAHDMDDMINQGSPEYNILETKFPMIVEMASEPLSGRIPAPRLPSGLLTEPYISPADFTGFFLKIVEEINSCFSKDCPIATSMLLRKLIESLVVSILQKKYGSTHPEYYQKPNGKTLMFGMVLSKFWDRFENTQDIIVFSPVTASSEINIIKSMIDDLKDGFNVEVHQLGVYSTKENLINKRSEVLHVLTFLKHIDDRIQ
jgi:hypothetical protein